MIWLRPSVLVGMMLLTTCVADRLDRLERQMKLMKAFESYVMARLDTVEGDVGSLTDRVSKLESLVATSDTEYGESNSNGSRTAHTRGKTYTEQELNDIQNRLTMYKHSFAKQKKELIDVNFVVKDTLCVFISNASSTVNTLVNTVSDHVQNSADNISASLEKNVYATRAHVQNETIQLEKKVEELISRANEAVGIIDDQRATIEDAIMATIRALHSFWSDWSAWSDCSKSCDKGSRSRHRSCDVPPLLTDGICIGNDTDTEECVIHESCQKTRTCASDVFECSTGLCISMNNVCDGILQCPDGSDENNCETRTCASDRYRCSSGRCISKDWVCNGYSNCLDGGDEEKCETCASDATQCSSGKCIRKTWVCDGDSDCPDGDDEKNCDSLG